MYSLVIFLLSPEGYRKDEKPTLIFFTILIKELNNTNITKNLKYPNIYENILYFFFVAGVGLEPTTSRLVLNMRVELIS